MKRFLFIFITMFLAVPVMAKICMVNDPTILVNHTQLETKLVDMDNKITALTTRISNIEAMYPIGAIYISTTATNPAGLIGFGTWEQYAQGRVLVGVGTGIDARGESRYFTNGGTNGEYNHLLSIHEMPLHAHTARGTSTTKDAPFGTGAGVRGPETVTTSAVGGNGAHNNLQPYIVVYMWHRIS